ncbi:aminotransferase class III-fold pyridoxal phosphate-dependent enzyme [Streptomyces sp. NPDC056373]|uniref:aminotransferase class III-fold pyridoxal phosphate-dependent enzyme n=1 Tax=Streptomyces sp. NPDC056373 TaxID=3345798 RepID=UPI0035DC6443
MGRGQATSPLGGAREDTAPAPRSAHEGFLRRQAARESAARTYARALPIVPVRARGLTIEGADGRRYLDCLSGAGTLALGHNHPVVLESLRKVLDSGAPLNALDLATPVKDAFLTELLRTLPRGLADRAHVRFCGPAGSEAVETAYALVRAATGRNGLVTFTGAGDRSTARAFDVTSAEAHGARITRLPDPRDHRCAIGAGGEPGSDLCSFGAGGERGSDLCSLGARGEPGPDLAAGWTEFLLDHPAAGAPLPAGVIIEPVRSEGGVIPVPDTWLRRVRRLTADRSVPLIADEIRTGVGRTGAFWAVEHSGVTPDVMVLSDAIGGSLPLAVVVYRDDLDVGEPGTSAESFPGNQLAMAAGTATLAHVRENALAERAATLGARMLNQLQQLVSDFACVADVRGRGLMIGVELMDPEGEREPGDPGAARTAHCGMEASARPGSGPGPLPAAPGPAAAVQRECLRRGLIVGLGGPHASVVHLLPPLTITDEQAAAVMDRLADAVGAAARDCGAGTAAAP